MKNLLKTIVIITILILTTQSCSKEQDSSGLINSEKLTLASEDIPLIEDYGFVLSSKKEAFVDFENSRLVIPVKKTNNYQMKQGGICIRIYIATRKSGCKSGIGFRCKFITGCSDNPNKNSIDYTSDKDEDFRWVNAVMFSEKDEVIIKFDKNIDWAKYEN